MSKMEQGVRNILCAERRGRERETDRHREKEQNGRIAERPVKRRGKERRIDGSRKQNEKKKKTKEYPK